MPRKTDKSDAIADAAEDLVASWASAAGFVVNRVQRDRAGWDHVLDLSEPRTTRPNPHLLGIPQRSLSARVQIKSTRGSANRVPVLLSNLQRAIEDPWPWLFVILRYEQHSLEPVEIVIRHLDRALIEKVMARIHKLDDAARASLHKRTFGLTWTEDDVLKPPIPATLRTIVEAMVPGDLHSYAGEKARWQSGAGLSPTGTREVSFQIVGATEDDLYWKISRAAVGLEESIPVSAVQFSRERFGTMRADPEVPPQSTGELGMLKSDRDAGWMLSLLDDHGAHTLDIEATLRFSAAIIPRLPEKYWLTRIETRFLELLAEHGSAKVSLTLRLPLAAELVPAGRIASSLRLLSAMRSDTGKSVTLQARKGETRLPFKCSLPASALGAEFDDAALQVQQLIDLYHELRIDEDTPISFGDIRRHSPTVRLMLAARKKLTAPVLIQWAETGDRNTPPGRCAVITVARLPVGSMVVVELLVITGEPCIDDTEGHQRVTLVTLDVSSLGTFKYSRDEHESFPFDQLADEAECRLREAGMQTVRRLQR